MFHWLKDVTGLAFLPAAGRLIIATFMLIAGIGIAVLLMKRPKPDRAATWAECMAGAVGVFGLFTLAYGVVPSEWLVFANSYLNMSTDRFVKWPPWPLTKYVKFPFSAVRDIVAVLIYLIAVGATLWLFKKWQERSTVEPAGETAETREIEPAATSRFGRPLRRLRRTRVDA